MKLLKTRYLVPATRRSLSFLSINKFLSGVQLLAVGIIGEYIARIYDEVKRRPKYIVKTKMNVKGKPLDESDWR